MLTYYKSINICEPRKFYRLFFINMLKKIPVTVALKRLKKQIFAIFADLFMNPRLLCIKRPMQTFVYAHMENQNHLNQNPGAMANQEENSRENNLQNDAQTNTDQPTKTVEADLSDADQLRLRQLISGQATESEAVESDTHITDQQVKETQTESVAIAKTTSEGTRKQKKEEAATAESVVSASDEARIKALLSDATVDVPSVLPTETDPIPQAAMPLINKTERNEIAELIASNQSVPEPDEDDESDIDPFENLNKLQLVELLEETVQDNDIQQIKGKVAAIKVQFLKLNKEDIEREYEQFIADGGDKESFEHTDDPLEVRFKAAFGLYKESKARFNEQLEKQKQINLQEKQGILEALKELIASEETLKKTYDEFKVLQDQWRAIGPVPAGEINNLWNNYHFLVEKFFDKVKINRELRDLDMKKNLESKIELCEKAEELLLEKSVVQSFRMLQKYHDEWKEIGPVPQDKKDEIWDRFKNATDQINQRRREHYAKLQEEQEQNLEAKQALCEKMEELIVEPLETVGQWQKRTKQITDLFGVWRTIGQAPKKHNDDIWKRFKGAMDSFFDAKKEFFGRLKEQQLENYNLKLDLCAQAEAIQDSTDWRHTTEALKKLQADWKKIGPVPRKHSDKIWKRFRAACDTFFQRKSEHFTNLRGNEAENLEKKKALVERIQSFESLEDKAKNLEAIKGFQREWMEIGHVPIKAKDDIQKKYRKAIDSLFDKLKVSEAEVTAVAYEDMVESMKDMPDGRDKIRRERIQLNNRISKLREEIHLWENNIGFFANSKQANIMVAEYEKKIKRAKNDLKILETKLRVLKE